MKSNKCLKVLTATAVSAAALFAVQNASAFAEGDVVVSENVSGIATQFGDVNFDKSVGISDAVQLQRYLLGQQTELGNWLNADIDEDGVVDVYDFTMLRKQVRGQKAENGGTLSIRVVDVMTGKPLESVEVELFGHCSDYCYELADWEYTPDDDTMFSGLPTDEKYSYLVNLKNLPEGYGTRYGEWDQQYTFGFDGKTDRDITIHVRPNDAENNVSIAMFDWAAEQDIPYCPYGIVSVSDKDGNPYYPFMHTPDIALPDGEYHADIRLFDCPAELLDPESDFAKHMKEIYPDLDFEDKSNGFDFTVKDGKADRDLSFDFAPKAGSSNYLTVNCIDTVTGKPLEGVKVSLIEAPDTYAKKVAEWTSDKTGTTTFDNLIHTAYRDTRAYMLHVDKVPEGYSGGFDKYCYWGYVNEYTDSVTYYFAPDEMAKEVSANVFDFIDGTLRNDVAGFDVWRLIPGDNIGDSEQVMKGVKCGEKFALSDGEYFAALDGRQAMANGYHGIAFYTKNGKKLTENLDKEGFIGSTSVISFTVKDGKPDRDLVFYVKDYDPADDEVEEDIDEFPDKTEEE